MSEREAFERILSALHQAALDPAGWPSAAALIDDALGTHGSSLVSGGGGSEEDYPIYFAWTCFRGERRRDLERLWFETYHPLDEGIPRLRRLPFNRLFHITDLYTDEERKTSAAYNALRTFAHAGNAIDVHLDGPDGSCILWQVNDPIDGEHWSSAQRDSIKRLMPHIRQTVHVQLALAAAGALGATLRETLDATGLGVVQLDTRGRIVAANDRARALLRTGDDLFDEGGLLSARMPQDNADLQGLLNRALPPFGVQGAGGTTIVRRPGDQPPLVLQVHPVSWQDTDIRMQPVAALVLIVDPAGEAGIDPAVAAAALGLTRTESRVAVLLARDMSVREIAASMDRKESTIRTHVKHMFAKHGLSRQSDLVRLVRSLAGTPEAQC